MKKGLFAVALVVMMLAVTAIPAFADDPGVGNSDFVVQNVDTTTATVSVDYYDQTGTNDVPGTPITIAGNGSQVFSSGTLPVGDGWIGSVVVNADKQVAAVTNLSWTSNYGSANDKFTGGSYSGTYNPGTDLYLPYATIQPVASIPGKPNRFSIITVQNAGTGDAHIHMNYYNQVGGALTATVDDTIQAGRSKSYNLSQTSNPKVPALGASWQGSVYVKSDDQPIAGVVTSHWGNAVSQQWGSAYEGVSTGSTTIYAPSVFRFDGTSTPSIGTWVRSSNILVMNAGTQAATIKVELYEVGNSTPKMTINDTIAPKAMGEYNTRFGSTTNAAYPASAFATALGNSYNGGSAVITCSNGQPLVASFHTFWWRATENAASTYVGIPDGATDIYVPYAPRKMSGANWTEWSKIALQNLGDSTANVTITFNNLNGTQALQLTDTIAGKSSDAYNTRFGSDGGHVAAAAFGPLGSSFQGSVHIHSSQPLVAVVNVIGIPIFGNTYNAYVP